MEDINATNSDYTPYSDRIETYLVPIIFAIIFIVGVLGNGTLVVVYSYVRHRGMRNGPNTYISSLALANLPVILICVPFVSVIYTLESWLCSEAICRISETGKDISIGVSVFTLTVLSAERNPTESVVISNYDYGSTKKKNNIISKTSTDGVTIMTIRDFITDNNE